MARLSVITCNFNYEIYVSRAIRAILCQSRLPDEYVIVDDGSTDDSVSVIR
jgi:glycosyltransferase involved in cell wall biosynthesis